MTRNECVSPYVDEWDVDTAAELVPLIDMERALSEKDKEIKRLQRALEDKDKARRALSEALHNPRKRKIYPADILMLIIAIAFIYSVLIK